MEITKPITLDQNKVLPSRWYHLKVLAYRCRLIAAVDLPSQALRTTITVNDDDCAHAGRAGLRSYASGGIWRNVVIRPATQSDVAEMLPPEQIQNGQNLQQTTYAESFSFHAPVANYRPRTLPSSPNAQPIDSLKLLPIAKQENTTVRGIVILTSPALFIQDSTGGVLVKESAREPVRVGDEVEATGIVRPSDFSPTLENATVRVLWSGTPMPALSLTASQAATGAFDATFIEVEGRLRRKERGPDDALIFDFDSGPQAFRAVMKRGRGDYLYNRLKLDSLLRIRGVWSSTRPIPRT